MATKKATKNKILDWVTPFRDEVRNEGDLAVEIGTNIYEARICRGFTQAQLASRMKTLQPSIARAESGGKLPGLQFLLRVAKALNTSVVPPTFKCIQEADSYLDQLEGAEKSEIAHDTLVFGGYSNLFHGNNYNTVRFKASLSGNVTREDQTFIAV